MLKTVVGSVAGIGLALSLVASSAGAQEPRPEPLTPVVAEPSDGGAQLEDLATFAKERNLPVDQVVEQYAGQEDFSRLVAQIDSIDANALVEARWNPDSKPHGEFVLTKTADAAAAALLSKSADVQVQIADLPSRLQREAAVESAYQAVWNSREVTSAVGWSDSETGKVVIEYVGSPDESLQMDRRAGDYAGSIELRSVGSLDSGLAYRGGMITGSCTAAFVVRSGSTYGITGAAHCPAISIYDGANFSPVAVLASGSGDLRWSAATSGSPSNAFQYSPGAFRYADSGLNPGVGTVVCKYGRTTGYNCSTVYGTGYCNAGYCGLYASTENIVASGDSGGPWFYGNGAKGISNGYGPVGGATRSFFTRIGAVNLLNTVVFTG